MKTYHVGGVNPVRRCKTLEDALTKVKDDDTIELHKPCKFTGTISKHIILKGNGNTITVESGRVGFICDVPLVMSDVSFSLESRANALKLNQGGELTNIKIGIKSPVRVLFPAIILTGGNLTIRDSILQKVNTHPDTSSTFVNCTFTDYYGGITWLPEQDNLSILNGKTRIEGSVINCCAFGGDTSIIQSQMGVFNLNVGALLLSRCSITPSVNEPSVNLKKEPADGPLKNKNENTHFSIQNDGGEMTVSSYTSQIPEEFVGIHSLRGSVEIVNTANDDATGYHLIQNTTLSFVDTTDSAFYDLNSSTLSMVRSKVNVSEQSQTAMEKLNNLIGLEAVKKQIKTIMNTITVNQDSNTAGDFSFSHHMVFAGDPGTGKTTVAKIVAQALFEIGAIPENKCTEVSVDSLVKGYVGQTAENVRNILDDALGGVVFIDEAYELTVRDNQNSFNSEVLSVLIRYMEEHRDQLVVIAAGYTKEMKEFIASNVGLTRRFQWIEFEDYTTNELVDIFEMIRKSYGDEYEYEQLTTILPKLFELLTTIYKLKPDAKGRVTNGGNGGLVRNVYQQVLQTRNNRIVEDPTATRSITQDDITTGFKNEMEKAKRL